MRNEQKSFVSRAIGGLAEYYEKSLTPLQLEMYVEDLLDLSQEDLIKAIRLYRNDPEKKFFPRPAELKGVLSPTDEEKAQDAVTRIVYALKQWGDPYGHQPEKQERAKNYLGTLGWKIVEREGGWAAMSNLPEVGPVVQSQWRRSAVSFMKTTKLGIEDEPPALEGGGLKSLGTLLKSIGGQS